MSQISTQNQFKKTHFLAHFFKKSISYPFFLIGALLLFANSSFAQSSTYVLTATDDFGDGWQGASIEITTITDGTISYALDANGPTLGTGPESINFTVLPGETAMLCEVGVEAFPTEVGYTVTDPLGVVILEVLENSGALDGYQGFNTCFDIIGIDVCPGSNCLECDSVTGDCLTCPSGFVLDPTDPTSCIVFVPCNLTSAIFSNVICNDAGTPCDPTDDEIIFDLEIQSAASGSSTLTSIDGTISLTFPNNFPLQNVSIFGINAGSGDIIFNVVDDANPTCSISAVLVDPGSCSIDDEAPVCTANDITVILDATTTATITAADINGGSSDNCEILSTDVSPSTFGCGDVGDNIVTLTVTDVNGNVSTCDATVTVEVSTSAQPGFYFDLSTCTEVICPPGTSCPGNTTEPIPCPAGSFQDAEGQTECISCPAGTAQSATGQTACLTCLDGTFSNTTGATECTDCVLINDCVGCDQVSGDCTECPAGFELDPNDPNSCIASCDITAVVFSNITCDDAGTPCDPNDDFLFFDVEIQNPAGGFSILSAPGAFLNLGIPNNVLFTGNDFPGIFLGNGDITVTVTDSNDPTCTTTVILADPGSCSIDDEAPVCTAIDFTTALDANGTATITAADINGGATDNCGILSTEVSPSTFGCGDVGDNIVTLTVTDVNGNVSTCDATVTVVDDVAPSCTTNDITVTLDASGNATITAENINNGSNDNCTDMSSLVLSVSQTDFTCADLGANTVTLTVTDLAGNSSTCLADVTVESTTPVITCPADITVGSLAEDTGVATATSGTVTFTDVTTSSMVTRTWVATGVCTSVTCVQIITIVVNTPPTINCPADLVLSYAGLNAQDAAIQAWLDSATGTDNGVSVTVSNDYDVNLFSECVAFGTQTVTFSTAAGETCTATVTVNFTQPTCTTEGFESLSAGDIVSTQLAGVTVSAVSNNNPNAGNRAMIFDSANPTGGDNDLGSAVAGNILIISEDGDSSDPDDDAQGGTITFDFATPQYIGELSFLDIDNTGSTITLFDSNNNVLQTISVPYTGDSGSGDLIVNVEDVSKMEVMFIESGALDDLCTFDQDLIPLCEDIGCMTTPDCVAEDFEIFQLGDIISTQIVGTTVYGFSNNFPNNNAAMIFDSENPTGGDYDLATANDGFILILSEDGDSSDPDDAVSGGILEFTFDTPQFVDHITILDIQNNNSSIKLFSASGALIDEISIPAMGNGNQDVVDISTNDVTKMEVHFQSSGAIVDYCTYTSGSLVDCPPVTCGVQVLFSDFEGNTNGGYGVWTDGGSDSNHSAFGSPRVVQTSGVRLRDNTGSSNIRSQEYDLSTYESLTLDFTYYTESVENGEDFFFEISTDGGSSYTIVEDWVRGTDFSNNTRYFETLDIAGPFSDEVKFRFRADFSVNNDRVYLDDILITGCTTSGPPPAFRVSQEQANEVAVEEAQLDVEDLDELSLYPIPASTTLTVKGLDNTAYHIYSIHGILIKEGTYTAPIELAPFESGTYILRAIDGRAARFIKL